jgi:hypothetical protein
MCPSALFGKPKALPPAPDVAKTEVGKDKSPPQFGSKTKSDARTQIANRSGTSKFRIDLSGGGSGGSGLSIPTVV